jgi:hypothetical protein
MPLRKPEDFGTEADGSLSKAYCSMCYQNGKWTTPDITMEEMLQLGMKGIDENLEMIKFQKFLIKLIYPSSIKKLKRWKK